MRAVVTALRRVPRTSKRCEKKIVDNEIEGSEKIQPVEPSKPLNRMQALPTMPWNYGGASQFATLQAGEHWCVVVWFYKC